MQIIFILTVLIGTAYLLFSRRRFDFFTLGFFSSCIYFIPGIAGYCLYPSMSADGNSVVYERVRLADGTYNVMTAVLISVLIGAILFDFLVKEGSFDAHMDSIKYSGYIAAFVSIVSLILLIFTAGNDLYNTDKNIMLESLNRWYVMYIVSSSIGSVILFTQKKWKPFFLCICIMIFDLYIGNRASFVITILAILTIELSRKGNVRFVFKNFKLIFLTSTLGILVFVYKFLYPVIRVKDWNIVFERIFNPGFYVDTIMNSEPFITQAILNKIVESNFTAPMAHFKSVFYQFILFAPEFGASDTTFNAMFQPVLFPGLDFGMANNIWAEMVCSGGWLLLLNFILLNVVILFIGSYLLKYENSVIKGGITLFMSYWAFYIHRNEISYQLNLEKRILIFWLAFVFISVLISKVGARLKLNEL